MLMPLALAASAALQSFGGSDFLISDGQRYVARGDDQAATLRVLDTATRRWSTFVKPAGCAPPLFGRPSRSGRLLLACERVSPMQTYVMFLRTGTTRRLRGGTGFYFSVGRWWARGDERTYVNLQTGQRMHPEGSRPRNLDDARLSPVRTCHRFVPQVDEWLGGQPLTWEGAFRAVRLARGRLVLQSCDGANRELAAKGATSVSLSAGIVTWRKGLSAFAFDVSTARHSTFRLPGVSAESACYGTRRTGSVLHTRHELVWRAVTHYDDADGDCLPGRYAGFGGQLPR
jgi:hypothetical protein